jgi:hypothetical protein
MVAVRLPDGLPTTAEIDRAVAALPPDVRAQLESDGQELFAAALERGKAAVAEAVGAGQVAAISQIGELGASYASGGLDVANAVLRAGKQGGDPKAQIAAMGAAIGAVGAMMGGVGVMIGPAFTMFASAGIAVAELLGFGPAKALVKVPLMPPGRGEEWQARAGAELTRIGRMYRVQVQAIAVASSGGGSGVGATPSWDDIAAFYEATLASMAGGEVPQANDGALVRGLGTGWFEDIFKASRKTRDYVLDVLSGRRTPNGLPALVPLTTAYRVVSSGDGVKLVRKEHQQPAGLLASRYRSADAWIRVHSQIAPSKSSWATGELNARKKLAREKAEAELLPTFGMDGPPLGISLRGDPEDVAALNAAAYEDTAYLQDAWLASLTLAGSALLAETETAVLRAQGVTNAADAIDGAKRSGGGGGGGGGAGLIAVAGVLGVLVLRGRK